MTAGRGKKTRKLTGVSEKVIRLLELYLLIGENRYPALDYLAEHFGVTRRTVLRYLEIIRTIEAVDFDSDRKGYFFPTGGCLKKNVVSKDDFVTILAVSDAVSHLGRTFQGSFQRLTEKIFTVSSQTAPMEQRSIVVRSPHTIESSAMEECLRILPICIREKRSVDIVYRAGGGHKETARTVDPYGLILHEGIWIFIGFCNLRKRIRSFALDRIVGIKERNRYFTPRDDFDLSEYLSRTWGVIDGEEAHVVIRFRKEAAVYIIRRNSWHPSERRKMLPDGGVELEFTIAGTLEIKKWIYSWLPYVEVIKPLSLRRQIYEELSQAAAAHSK